MKLSALLCGTLALATGARAAIATGLSSFEAIEETLVKYFPKQDRFERDDAFPNIVDLGHGIFRFSARYNADWWDGDRDTQNKDRQRMEVKGLGPHQKHGEVFIYTTTWRSSPGFRGSSGFCHLFQLKAINGDAGAPLITLSIHGDKATVEANPAGRKIIAREFPWRPETWQHVMIRARVSPNAEGELRVSVDGDDFQGVTGVELSRPEADEYRPKWGLYRRAAVNAPQLGNDYIEHRDVGAWLVGPGELNTGVYEPEVRQRARETSPQETLAWLLTKPLSQERDLCLATIAALWAESQPAAAMAWVETLPAGRARNETTARVFARWADADVKHASAWLGAHAPSAELDPVVWLFTTDTTYRYVNRPVALEALPWIRDAELRAKAFQHVLEIWARSDRAATLAFLEKTPALSAEQKIALATKLKASGGRPE